MKNYQLAQQQIRAYTHHLQMEGKEQRTTGEYGSSRKSAVGAVCWMNMDIHYRSSQKERIVLQTVSGRTSKI